MPISHRRQKRFVFAKFLLGTLLVVGSVYAYKAFHFNPQDLVENSMLKNKNFSTVVTEIVSPKHNIKAYLFEDKTNPIISVNFLFKNSGYAYVPSQEQGISDMVADLLTAGAGDMDRRKFHEELEKSAINISFSAGRDDIDGSLLTTTAQKEKAFALLKMVLSTPRFENRDIEQRKAEMLMMLKQQTERPEKTLALEFNKTMFGEHPYARNPLGEADSIKGINRKKLFEFMKNYLTRNHLIVGVAGDISPDEAGVMLDNVFGDLPEGGYTVSVENAQVDYSGEDVTIDKDLPQSIARFAAPGVVRSHSDFYPLYVANHILGGSGLTSRLSLSAREDEALTYGVYSYLSTTEKAPMLQGSFSATPENFARVKEIVEQEWQKIGEAGVSEEEFNTAKDYLLASYNLRFSSIATIADILVAMQRENLGVDFLQKRNEYIRNIKLNEVNTAAKKYFNTENLRFVTIGKNSAGKEK